MSPPRSAPETFATRLCRARGRSDRHKALLERLELSLANKSVETSKRYVLLWDDFLDQAGLRLNKEQAEKYLTRFRNQRRSSSYRRYVWTVLRQLYIRSGVEWPLLKTDIPKKGPVHQPFYTLEEVAAILVEARTRGLLAYAFVRLAAATGCRRDELQRLNREDFRGDHLFVKTSKGGRATTRPLDPRTRAAVEAYLKVQKDKDHALFQGRRGRLSHSFLSKMFFSICQEAGVHKEQGGLHALRRGFVTLLHNREGMSLKQIQDLMGWETAEMPAYYAQLEPGEPQEEVRKRHPWFKEGG